MNTYRVLILGGNRFVGKKLAQLLVKLNYLVTCFNRTGTAPTGCAVIKGDRNNEHDLEHIDFDSYDYVIDMCLFKVEQWNLLKAFISPETRYIMMSSAAVYDLDIVASHEEEELSGNGRSEFYPYGKEKLECETAVRSYMNNWTILRPPYIIGVGDHRDRIGWYVKQFVGNPNTPFQIPQSSTADLVNFVSANDMVKVLRWCMDDHAGSFCKVFNVADINATTLYAFVTMIWTYTRSNRAITIVPELSDDSCQGPFLYTPLNIYGTKLRNISKITFQSVSEIVREYIHWWNTQLERSTYFDSDRNVIGGDYVG